MKHIYILLLCLLSNMVFGQQTGVVRSEIRTIERSSADTNKVISDENGKELRYYQYMPLVRSGQYKVRYNGDPSLPETKGQLVRMTQEDKARVENIRMYGSTPNDGILKLNTALDVQPLALALQKDVFSKKALLLMFWSPEITSSMSAVAFMSTRLKAYNQDSLVVLLITTADNARAQSLSPAAAASNGIIVANAKDIFDAYKVTAMPLFIVADQDRVIRHNVTGTGTAIAESTREILDEVLGVVPPGFYTLNRDPKYKELSTKASLLFQGKNYPEAAKAFDALFDYSKGKSTMFESYPAAGAWARVGDKDKAFYYLREAVFKQNWRGLAALTGSEHFESLRSDQRWQGIIDQVMKNQAQQKITPAIKP